MKATVIDIGSDYIIVRHQFGIDGIYFDEEKLKQVSIGQEIELNINLPEGSKPIMQMPPIKCIEVSPDGTRKETTIGGKTLYGVPVKD